MRLLYIIFLSFVLNAGYTQTDLRTVRTKVVDAVLQYPAMNSVDLTNLNKELYPIAPDAVRVMTENLHNFSVANDAQLKFALNGLISYLSKEPKNGLVNETANALIKSLSSGLSVENKNFIFEQLMLIASENHLSSLKGFLIRDEFADVSSRLFTKLGGKVANDILLGSYSMANSFQKNHIVKAISGIGEEKGLDFLLGEFQELETKIQPVILQNFAQSGYAKSENLLKSLAEGENFAGEVNSKTHYYLQLLSKLYQSGINSTENQNKLLGLVDNSNLNTHLKLFALQSIFAKDKNLLIPFLLKNVQSLDRVLSQSAVNMLSEIKSEEASNQLFQILQKSKNPLQQQDLLNYFALNKFSSGTKLFSNLLKSPDNNLKIAALKALVISDPANAYNKMPGLMNVGNEYLTDAVKTELLRSDKSTFDKIIAQNFSKLNSGAKLAVLELLGKRKSTGLSKLVFSEANNSNSLMRDKAIEQLKYVVAASDYKALIDLLNKRNEKSNIAQIQEAIWSSMTDLDESKKRMLINATSVPNMKQLYKFYNLYSKLGAKDDLQMVKTDFLKNPVNAEFALDAFNAWKDGTAIDEVFSMAMKNSDAAIKEKALLSYINQINRSKYPDDQKLLLLKKIEPELKESKVQSPFIRALGLINTIQSLVSINKYLDNAKTKQTAINAVFNIVQNSNISGKIAREIVEKAIKLNTDSEALYIQEAVIKKVGTWSSDPGFISIFNGKDLSGWKGLAGNPISRSKMTKEQLDSEQKAANDRMTKDWKVENGVLVFDGKGFDNLCSEKEYEDFELLLDWRMEAKGDGGVYLRGSPQVQTWDTSRRDAGAQVGSGGLYNNQIYQSKPLAVADNPINEWNTFRIKMVGDKVTVYLNGVLVTDNVILENYWDRNLPIFKNGQIELQAHGTRLEFREIYIREIPKVKPYALSAEEKNMGFNILFDGVSLDNWQGNKTDYFAQEGAIVCKPTGKGKGNLYTNKEYSDFILRFEFQLTPGANNGLGIRTPLEGDAAYVGMELQILDNTAPIYNNLYEWQYHGSVYGVIPAKREYAKPVGEWNYQEVHVKGNHIKVTLNGNVIVDGDIYQASAGGTKTIDGKNHPGLLNKKGFIGFLGHGSPLKFRNIRIKEI